MKNYSRLTIPILILFALNLSNSVLAQTDSGEELISGGVINKTVSADEKHIYTVELENGMAIIGKVVQKGIDLVVDVYSPDGKRQKQIDHPNGAEGDEPFDITANQSGRYKFEIHTLEKDGKKQKG